MIVYRITSPHRYNRYLYPTTSGSNVYAADSVYDALTQRGRRLWWDTDGNLSREYYRRIISLTEEERFDRRLCHNEEGLMQGYWQESGDRHRSETVAAWYAYDAEGRRALKYASERAAGSAQSVVELCDPVYYVSPLVTLTRTGYSKHYFEGARRICTVIGGGFAHVNWDSITSDPMPLVGPELDPLEKVLLSGAEVTFNDCIEIRAYLSNTLALYKTMLNESEKFDPREPAFYYHTDHLGSTSRFTDDSGRVVQTLAYMPYGEDWVDDSKFIYSDTNHIGIYQFNGKERDFESGFYYYGARYHWPELLTGWTSPDPLMYEFRQWRNEPSPCESPLAGNRRDLGFSPYNYCNWNPVIFVDPDGRDVRLSKSAQGIHNRYYNKKGYERYTSLFDKLNNDHSVLFNIKECNDNSYAIHQGANGIVDYSFDIDEESLNNYSNGTFNIEWGDPAASFGGTSEHVLLEELFHAGQIVDNNYNLSAAATISQEYDAKRFSIDISRDPIQDYYNDIINNAYNIPTELSIIKQRDEITAKTYLKYGIKEMVKEKAGIDKVIPIGKQYKDIPWK